MEQIQRLLEQIPSTALVFYNTAGRSAKEEAIPWMVLFSGVAILMTVLAFNLLGDALRDALEARLVH